MHHQEMTENIIGAADEAQLLDELKATGIKVGLLINFGRQKVEFRRFVY